MHHVCIYDVCIVYIFMYLCIYAVKCKERLAVCGGSMSGYFPLIFVTLVMILAGTWSLSIQVRPDGHAFSSNGQHGHHSSVKDSSIDTAVQWCQERRCCKPLLAKPLYIETDYIDADIVTSSEFPINGSLKTTVSQVVQSLKSSMAGWERPLSNRIFECWSWLVDSMVKFLARSLWDSQQECQKVQSLLQERLIQDARCQQVFGPMGPASLRRTSVLSMTTNGTKKNLSLTFQVLGQPRFLFPPLSAEVVVQATISSQQVNADQRIDFDEITLHLQSGEEIDLLNVVRSKSLQEYSEVIDVEAID
jgi:hypothetical protein